MARTRFNTWVVSLLVVIGSVLTYGIALLNQSISEVKKLTAKAATIADDQTRFRDNFSNYMNCLIVNEEEVVIAVGEEAYVEICKRLLYLGIDPIPPTIKADPSLLTTTTTGPSGS